jgi:hypothetical protein
VFAAKLIALQAAGGLPAAAGDIRDQIKLYTYGAPRVGNSQFAAYLEDNMLERYRCGMYRGLLVFLQLFCLHLHQSAIYKLSRLRSCCYLYLVSPEASC